MTYGNYDKEPTRRPMSENKLNSLLNPGKAQKAQDVQEAPKKPLFEKTFDDFNTDTKTNDEYIDRTEFREGVMPELDEKLDTEMAGDVKQKAMALFDRYSGADKKLNIDEFNKMKKDLDKIVELAYEENIKNLGSAVADALIGYTTEDDANAVRRSLDSLKPDELMAFLKGYIENGGDGRNAFFQQLQSEYCFDRLDDTLRLGAYIMSEFARKHGLNDIVARIKVELLNPEIDVKNAKALDKIAFELLERFEPQWWEGN